MKKIMMFISILILHANTVISSDNKQNNLISAVLSDKYIEAEKILKSGFNADTPGERGETALITASRYRKLKMAALLLKYGADVNKKNSSGETALMAACGYGSDYVRKSTTAADKLAVVKVLLKAGADVNVQEKTIHWTPLIYAASDGKNTNLSAIELLVNYGADIHHKGRYGTTALIKAANVLRYDIVSYLISKGADINAVDTVAHGGNSLFAVLEGSTGEAVHFDKRKKEEVLKSKSEIIRLLLEKKKLMPVT